MFCFFWLVNLRDVRERLSHPEEDTGLRVPSAATLSRARIRLDVLMMQWRAQRFKLEPAFFIYLSSDSSPQGGRDFLMSIEDCISRHHASLFVNNNPQALARLSLDPWACEMCFVLQAFYWTPCGSAILTLCTCIPEIRTLWHIPFV